MSPLLIANQEENLHSLAQLTVCLSVAIPCMHLAIMQHTQRDPPSLGAACHLPTNCTRAVEGLSTVWWAILAQNASGLFFQHDDFRGYKSE